MAGGGSISLRLSLAGSDQIKAALASLGPAGSSALRQIEAAAKAPTAGMQALSAAGKDVTGSLQGLAGRAGTLGSGLMSLGPAGLAAAAGIGALVAGASAAMAQVVKAADWAEDIQRTARAMGISTTALQEFDFVAQAAGIPVQAMRSSLQGLAETVGVVQDNLIRGKQGRQVKVFEAIFGTDAEHAKEDLRSYGGELDAILPKILDYAAKLAPTERAGFAQSLKMDPRS